jgi:hypothetical protein
MGGSGGGSSDFRFKRRDLETLRREAEEAARRGRLDAEVNNLLSERLIEINQRDTDKVRDRLDETEAALKHQIEEFDRLVFGWSVAKNTYVEGLSDVDSLVVLEGNTVKGQEPEEVMAEFAQLLRSNLNMGEVARIRQGTLAVTVEYKEGPEIQLLPAIDREGQLSIASSTGRGWLKIEPRRFAEALTAVNQQQAGAVVPAIKLAKAVIANLPQDQRLTGYHTEALALGAFSSYQGPRNPKAMVSHFFEAAAQAIKRPVPDVTGQSRHVDESLGPANSDRRQELSGALARVSRRMKTAKTLETWREMVGGDG